MSQYVVVDRPKRVMYKFGWDPPLNTYFLQVHDLSKDEDDDDRVKAWLGADQLTEMYEVEHLVASASEHGLHIGHTIRLELFEDKDKGR